MRAARPALMIRGMNMKLMTVLAVASLAIAGVACSESKAKPASDATEAMKVEADSGSGGTDAGTCTSQVLGASCNVLYDPSTACGACVSQNCCTKVEACFASLECSGLVQCLSQNCASASDPNACAQQQCGACLTDEGLATYNTMAQCFVDSCAAPCGY